MKKLTHAGEIKNLYAHLPARESPRFPGGFHFPLFLPLLHIFLKNLSEASRRLVSARTAAAEKEEARAAGARELRFFKKHVQ